MAMTKKEIIACLENDVDSAKKLAHKLICINSRQKGWGNQSTSDIINDAGDARELAENLYASLSVLLKNAKETP